MTSSDSPRWPLKGPTALAVMACGSLWFVGQRAEEFTQGEGAAARVLKGAAGLQGDGAVTPDQLEASLSEALGDELAAYGPFSGFTSGELSGGGLGGLGGAGNPAGAGEEEPERTRPPGWVYPAFDEPAEGLHGPPATELPRNVSFQLVNEDGDPLDVDDVAVFERTVDGEVKLSPYRSGDEAWSFGVRGIMTGSRAYFRVQVRMEGAGEAVSRTLVLDDVGSQIDIDAGRLAF